MTDERERRDVKRMMESMSVGDLHDLLDERDRLSAEVERLTSALKFERELYEVEHDRADSNHDEAARISAALERACDIAESMTAPEHTDVHAHIAALRKAAQ